MRRLHLGAGLNLPLDAVTETIAILAKRGSGKTYTASVLAEELLKAGQPLGVLDPTGAWYGLRSSADGKGEGFPITILGGDHADVPLDEAAGKDIAEIMVQERVPLVLDLSRLSKAAMRRFVADFAEHLYQKNREPLHLIIDEADAFAPQKPRPDEMRMLGALDDIVRRGRIRGLGVTLVTQRSAVLNKDVLTQAEVLIALRTPHPKDRAPVLEWMKVHATPEQMHQVEESLAGLEIGEAWVMSAGWLDLFRKVRIRKRETFNSSATPKPGEKRVEPRKLAQVDLDALQKKFSAAIEQAKATDPRALQKKVAELQSQVKKLEAAKGPKEKVEIEIREVYVVKDSQVTRLTKAIEKLDTLRDRMAQAQQVVVAEAGLLREALARATGSTQPALRPATQFRTQSPPPPARPVNHPAVAQRTPAGDHQATGDGPLPLGERSVLTAVAQHPQGVTRQQITVLTGYKTSTRNSYLARLEKRGAVALDGDRIFALLPGLLGDDFRPLPTGAALRDHWLQELPEGERKIFEVLVKTYPGAVEREQLSEATGYKTSTRNSYIHRLQSRQLVTESARGQVRASDNLFMETAGG